MRSVIRPLAGLAALAALAGPAAAQNQDAVKVLGTSKEGKPVVTTVTGKLTKESPAGVTIAPAAGKPQAVPLSKLVDVVYAVPAAVRLQLLQPTLAAEEKGEYDKALKLYGDMVKQLEANKGSDAAKRHAAFKVAVMRAAVAEQAGKPEGYGDAVDGLKAFVDAHPNSWQAVPAGKQLARLLVARKDYDKAVKVYDDLAKLPELGDDTKQQLNLLSIDAMIAGGKVGEAESKLQAAVTRLKAGDPQLPRLKVYLIGCKAAKGGDPNQAIAELTKEISASSDPAVRALAYNTLGDAYLAAKRPEDAKFAFLMVDVVMNQDKTEHAKAVEKLAALFKEAGDEQRAEDYKAKLLRVR